MRTIEELRSKLIPLPSRFAEEAEGDVAISKPEGDEGGMTFEDGFPAAYSESPKAESPKGKYVQRNDMNRLGEIASREALFKEAGGIHTYLKKVADDASGYPRGAILNAYDGTYLGKVESTESGVRKAFADDESHEAIPLVIPNVIDCPVKDDDDSQEDALPERVLWKSVNWIYGAEEGLFHLDLDYTRAQILPREGGIIQDDSLVVGVDVAVVSVLGNYAPTAIPPLTYDTTIRSADGTENINWSIKNKGHEGNVIGSLLIPWVGVSSEGGYNIKPKEIPVIKATGGTGNYALSFFAKAGTFFTGQNHIYLEDGTIDLLRHPDAVDKNFDPYINWVAIPFKTTIRTLEEAAEA